jgi:hypothetical protein
MDLIRDVLDKQIVDRAGDRLGKVDGLVVTLTEGEAPRVSAIEVGPVTLARRISPRLASLVQRLLRVCHAGPGITRFDTAQVLQLNIEVRLDVVADDTPAREVEHWLREHVVRRFPGSGVKG